jgi:hypothetical protein
MNFQQIHDKINDLTELAQNFVNIDQVIWWKKMNLQQIQDKINNLQELVQNFVNIDYGILHNIL